MTTTARFGLVLALASIPPLTAASFHLLYQSSRFPGLTLNNSNTNISADQQHVFATICNQKTPMVILRSDGTLTAASSKQQKWLERKINCPKAFSMAGIPKHVGVLTRNMGSSANLCDQVSRELFHDFMDACLTSEDDNISSTVSFRYAQIKVTPNSPSLTSDENTFQNSKATFSTGTKNEVHRLPSDIKNELHKGFTVHTNRDKKGNRHYTTTVDSQPLSDTH